MATSNCSAKRRNKKYTPKGVNRESWKVAMQGAMLLSETDQAIRANRVRDAVALIAAGSGDVVAWSSVFDAVNLLEQFSRSPKIMTGAADYILSMHIVISAVLERRKNGGDDIRPAEVQDLRDFADLYAEVLSVVTHHEYRIAEEKTRQRLWAIRNSCTKGVTVLEVA
jgi:hypothetical protein